MKEIRTLLLPLLLLALCNCTYLGYSLDERCRDLKRKDPQEDCKEELALVGMQVDQAVAIAVRDELLEVPEAPVVLAPLPCTDAAILVCSAAEDRCWCDPGSTPTPTPTSTTASH